MRDATLLKPLLTMDECANLLKVSTPALAMIIHRRTAPRVMKLGKSVRFHPDDIIDWMDSLRGIQVEKPKPGRPRKTAA